MSQKAPKKWYASRAEALRTVLAAVAVGGTIYLVAREAGLL